MTVAAIALYASPPSSVCSTPYPSQIIAHGSHDFDLNARSICSPSSTAPSSQKPIVGGLSCMFSSPSVKHASSSSSFSGGAGEDLGCLWHDRGDEWKELSSSFCYSPSKFVSSSLKREQSPVSVFQGPVSCSSSGSRSPPMRIVRDRIGDVNISSLQYGTNGLFHRFMRSALRSCVDYDSPTFQVKTDLLRTDLAHVIVDELTFNMEDNLLDCNPEGYAKELLLSAQLRHNIFYDGFVVKAFYEAEKAHRGQMRASGDPYLQHCVETAVLLALIGANSIVVAAGLLHDTLDDSLMNSDYISRTFGVGVADLVEGVSKLSYLSKLARENNTACKTAEADRLHTMFLAMADARAVLIKLADRLHNMMTLDALPFIKQQRFAKETLEIFVPLANRLGISNWKEQLENQCFKHLNPDQHKQLSSQFVESSDDAMITFAIDKLEQALKENSISYHDLYGRHKSLYSAYCKMLKKKLPMDKIHDIHGLRLITESHKDCYNALKVVNQLWPDVPGKFKDYITRPKFNGYQSLHTVVMGEGMVPLEVQIRTKEMHLQAEFGFAAHWRYKERECKYSSFVLQMVEWARWVITWQCETMSKEWPSMHLLDSIRQPCSFPSHSDDCPYSYKPHCGQEGPIFVIMIENDKMSVQEFCTNSTVMEALERSGRGSSRLSKEELRPRVNHEPVSNPMCKLKMGDVVELTPSIPDKSLTEYREEIKRMYDGGLTLSSMGKDATTVAGRSS